MKLFENLKGQVERVVYFNEESRYAVLRLKVKGRRSLVSAVGTMLAVNPGDTLLLTGHWENDQKYGEQFRFDSYETTMPTDLYGIKKFLGSGLIKGIGPRLAERIVSIFGKETLDVIEFSPDRLLKVPDIGKKRLEAIKKAWDEYRDVKELMIFFQTHGLGSGWASRVYKRYGPGALEVVKENPYRLATDVRGIGFKTADNLARSMGLAENSPIRAEAGIIYTLQELSGEGHVCFPRDALVERALEILHIEEDVLAGALAQLVRDDRIATQKPAGGGELVYLKPLYVAEADSARRLRDVIAYYRSMPEINMENAIKWVEREVGLELAPEQKDVFYRILDNKVVVITGGPGTGKTTVINGLIKVLSAKKLKVMLAAPTGRAAKRMAETTGREAKTIHRLLEFNPRNNGFNRNEDNPLEADFIIIDEMSMVDIVLWHHLLKAARPETSLILVGDKDQLPSVGPGNLLRDLIEIPQVSVVKLSHIFRQARASRIVTAAHAINMGHMPTFPQGREDIEADLFFISREDPEHALQTILELVTDRIPNRFGFDPLEDIQVISPMHKGVIGVSNLNHSIQAMLNPEGKEFSRGDRNFRVGDRVMQVVNDYEKDVFNGDIGRVVSLDEEEQNIVVRFPEREVNYDFSEADELSLAYAISVHKSQGSEYTCVILPLFTQHFVMLKRNLLYTAVTRGKKLVVLVGTKKALSLAVKNDEHQYRHTLFKDFVSGEIGGEKGL